MKQRGRLMRGLYVSWLICLTMLPMLVPSAVRAEAPVVLRLESIDASAHPSIQAELTVRDTNGVPLSGVTIDAFRVLEQRDEQPSQLLGLATHAEPEVPISLALVLDVSGSMEGTPFEDAKDAALALLEALGPQDRVALIAFSGEIDLAEPFPQLDAKRELGFTAPNASQHDLLETVQPGGRTPLYDAAYKAVRMTAQESAGNRAVLLFTDGRDEAATPQDPGSRIADEDDPIAEANRHNIPVFTVGLGDAVDEAWLQRVAMRTGGTYQHSPDSKELEELFGNVAELLKQRYYLTYRTDLPADGEEHSVRIELLHGADRVYDVGQWRAGSAPQPTAEPNATTTVAPTETAPPTAVPTEAPTATNAALSSAAETSGKSSESLSWLVGGAGGLLALGFVALMLLRRNRSGRTVAEQWVCPRCGRPLKAGQTCPDCGEAAVRARSAKTSRN